MLTVVKGPFVTVHEHSLSDIAFFLTNIFVNLVILVSWCF